MSPTKLKNLKPGTKLTVSKRYRNYWMKNAFDDCFMAPYADIRSCERHAVDYFIRQAIALNLEHTVEFMRYQNDVEGGSTKIVPGACVKLKVGPFEDCSYISHKDLEVAK